MKKALFPAVACTLVAFLAPNRAGATLGEDAASVATNSQHLKGSHVVRQLASVERHDLALPSGVLVEEFVAGGKVFAIAWRGPRAPNLRELLGNYFGELSNGAPLGHHRVMVRGSDIVIQSSGHRRSFSGKAWVPSMVPPEVKLESLFGARPE